MLILAGGLGTRLRTVVSDRPKPLAMVGDRLVLPERYWPAQTAISIDDLRRRQGETPRGVFVRHRGDRTLVYVLYGRDRESLRRMVDEFPP